MEEEFDEDFYLELDSSMSGVCEECGNVQGCVEPDAHGYTCEDCGEPSVIGALTYLENSW